MTQTSVIIASRNREESVGRLIKNLFGLAYPRDKFEIIVVDDCSDVPYSLKEDICLIRNSFRLGGPASRNLAISKASSEFILLLDDDMEILSRNLLNKSVDILKSNLEAGMVVYKKIDEVKRGGTTLRKELSCSAPSFYSGELKFIKAKKGYVDFGANAFFTYSDLLKRIGGFDPVFGKGVGHSFREESDLHVRLRRFGYKIYFEPSLVVVHHILPSGGHGQDPAKFLFWMAHNHIVFLRKNFKSWRVMSIGYIIDVIYYSLCWGRFRYLMNALKGYREGFRTIKSHEYK